MKIAFVTALFLFSAVLGACTMAKPGGMPVPDLTFAQIQPLQLEAGNISIDQEYDPDADPKDVSSRFVVPPHVALKRYARKRLQPGDQLDTLHFVIKDARVHHTIIDQKNDAVRWAKIGREDEYRVFITLELMPRKADGRLSGEGSVLRMERTLVIPERASLAEREMKQVEFLEQMISDIDISVTDALTDTMHMVQ